MEVRVLVCVEKFGVEDQQAWNAKFTARRKHRPYSQFSQLSMAFQSLSGPIHKGTIAESACSCENHWSNFRWALME